jgi:alpha-galactosidase
MIPPMLAIARDVEALCPDALFFNYGNPMGPICRGVRKHTGTKMVGLCHGVFHIARYIANALGADVSRMKYTAVGLNHLTWFTDIRVDGKDAMPKLREVGNARLEAVRSGKTKPADGDPFSWEMFELTGAFPAVLDRHVTEFFPQFFRTGEYYGQRLGVDAFSFEGTIGWGDRGFAEMETLAASADPLPAGFLERLSGEHEQVLDIIDSIRGDRAEIYSANLPNTGQIPNLPEGAIVEAPAVADGAGLHHLAQQPLAPALAGTIATRLQWAETVVEAAIEGSRDKFIEALILDGGVTSMQMARTMADELLAAHSQWLPQFK